MRILFAIPLLASVAACSVNSDSTNDQVTLEYNEQKLKEGASRAADTARSVATGVGNVAASAGQAISNEVGDVDVDIDVSRNRDGETGNSSGNTQ